VREQSGGSTAVSGLKHGVFFHDTDDDLTAAAVHFVRDGVERGEQVLVNTEPLPVTGLLRAMFSGEDQVSFSDAPAYTKPVSVVDSYRRTMDRGLADGVTGFRALGHIDFATTHLPWQEWLRYEAAVNRVFADYPLRTLCPYDTREVGPDIVAGLEAAHPSVLVDGRLEDSPSYLEPDTLLRRVGCLTPADPAQREPPTLSLLPVVDPQALPLEVSPSTLGSDLERADVDDFARAVVEVASNALAHGAPPVGLRLWARPDRLVCVVSDTGPGIADPLRGFARRPVPPDGTADPAGSGLGLWAARQLVDVLDYARGPHGFEVRLVSYR
jgi:anti-sigma regulatory factor (Ser/Thr protein kinase)